MTQVYAHAIIDKVLEGVIPMNVISSSSKGYILAAGLGALGGGVVAILVTRAIPRMMSRLMAGMMQNMMAQMKESGCSPSEI